MEFILKIGTFRHGKINRFPYVKESCFNECIGKMRNALYTDVGERQKKRQLEDLGDDSMNTGYNVWLDSTSFRSNAKAELCKGGNKLFCSKEGNRCAMTLVLVGLTC